MPPTGSSCANRVAALRLFPETISVYSIHKSFSAFHLRGEATKICLAGTAVAVGRTKMTIHGKREFFDLPVRKGDATMYQLSVYSITSNLWRWEIRCGGALLRCGTAPTRGAALIDGNGVVNA
jgi:hypothetical protein